ncbi:AI-2E family transporter [Pseudodesulfovibrio sp. zrk46]|uniref:AI-2E family transporter n=1 Tax=Pseudodesulfovibrio sp. zrk46 TaxID=2725288 RepID=UPI001448FF51|nr:AI-2E family transporter [Pseudodesulfovibrio sp. zrk46]QJB55871.1 AI-2E family transporter [Pseudodesulfovibrio sp. zrk46]
MIAPDKPYTFDSVVRMLMGTGFVIGLIWLLGYLSSALIPFVSALLLAYLLNPITAFLEEKLHSRMLAVLLTVLLVIGAATGIVMTILPMMGAEFASMGRVLRDLATNQEYAARVKAHLPPDLWDWIRQAINNKDIQDLFTSDGAATVAKGVFDKIMPGIKGVLRGTASFLGGFLTLGIILLYLVFLLADFGKIQKGWQDYIPGQYREGIVDFIEEFEHTMSRYFRSQVTIALIVGVLLSIGFLIIGLPMALVMGMLIGVLNIAPYLGTIGIIPAIFLGGLGGIETGTSPWMGMLLTLVVVCAVQIIQDGFLVPKIQGESLGLSPWMILLALSVWGKLLGFLGLLIALPMTCLCLSYYRRMLVKREAQMAQRSG